MGSFAENRIIDYGKAENRTAGRSSDPIFTTELIVWWGNGSPSFCFN